jgi:N6-adenosine-specific RNA methylase IME4
VTSPILEESFQVIRAWGFKYKASFVWDKVHHNMGHYNSVRHEFLLVCVRGSCQPDVRKLFDSVQSIERTEHSKKPAEFYGIIETIYTNGDRLEMFARNPREGWKGYGHQA